MRTHFVAVPASLGPLSLGLLASVFSVPSIASTTPVALERIVSARSEIQVTAQDERIIEEDFVIMTELGDLVDERQSALSEGVSDTWNYATQESFLSPEVFWVRGSIGGFSRNDEGLLICQSSPVTRAIYDFEVDVATPYRFTGVLDGTEGGSVVFRLDQLFVGDNIFLEFTQSESIPIDFEGVLEPGRYLLRLEASAYISPGTNQTGEFDIQGVFGSTTDVTEPASQGLQPVVIAPNPIRDGAWISLGIGNESARSVSIVDAAGRNVRNFAERGSERVFWNRRDQKGHAVPAGVYFVSVNGTIRGRAVVIR
ncbi:MAG: T9SS type A sorting domain-containing protein [Candidatus Eisenbacteria bacterium]